MRYDREIKINAKQSIIGISSFVMVVFIPYRYLFIYENLVVIDSVFSLKYFRNQVSIRYDEIKEVFLIPKGWDLGKYYRNRIVFNLIGRSPKTIYQIGESDRFLEAYYELIKII